MEDDRTTAQKEHDRQETQAWLCERATQVITTMAAQREQERAADAAHYKLRKACAERAVELRNALAETMQAMDGVPFLRPHFAHIDQLLKEIDDASH